MSNSVAVACVMQASHKARIRHVQSQTGRGRLDEFQTTSRKLCRFGSVLVFSSAKVIYCQAIRYWPCSNRRMFECNLHSKIAREIRRSNNVAIK